MRADPAAGSGRLRAAAVIAVAYAFLVGKFVYRELLWRDLYGVFLAAAKLFRAPELDELWQSLRKRRRQAD